MKLVINGREQEHPVGINGAELLALIDWPAATLVAEVNGQIVRKADFLVLELQDGDTLELVTLVGGG